MALIVDILTTLVAFETLLLINVLQGQFSRKGVNDELPKKGKFLKLNCISKVLM